MPGSPLSEIQSNSPNLQSNSASQYISVQPAQQQQVQQQQPSPQRLIQTQSGQQVVFVQDGSNQRVVMKEQRQPVQQTIQLPASMANHQLVVAQMPDGRQQIFALQGASNQGQQIQLMSQGIQQVQHVSLEFSDLWCEKFGKENDFLSENILV